MAARVAKKIPEMIHHVVYISGNIPPSHKSALDVMPFIIKLLNTMAIRSQVKRKTTPAIKMKKIIRNNFCNNCSEEIIDYVLEQELLSEPLCVAFEKNNWDNFPDINQTYILLMQDKTISVEKQKNMMNNLSIKNSYEIDSDHMVMLSKPEELARILNTLAK